MILPVVNNSKFETVNHFSHDRKMNQLVKP